MKLPHELDERVVVAESVEIGRGDEIGKVDDVPLRHAPDGGRTDALERLGLYEAMRGAKVCQHFEGLVQHQNLGRLASGLIHLGETGPCQDHRTLPLRSGDGTLSRVPS
ncbi:hypothetical protein GOBAR_AA15589 [Gossypium barbadense]|uniref:Uncharacterized protein n=1 Tax=Gossypium barbadense TaxID=3634 RepID=A0A2P5XP75_GOSBA|nr:hypothetical protein GOBAR_AA15589 [Gossypium barbadense]